MTAEEFVRRCLMHVLPERFTKIRYYGFMGNAYKSQRFVKLREMTSTPARGVYRKDMVEILKRIIGRDARICPKCKSLLTNPLCMTIQL